MSEPTPRQVLYALVAAGFWLVTGVLTAGAAAAGLTPNWWTIALLILLALGGVWMAVNWRRTGPVLVIAMVLFVIWMVGTLMVA